MTQPTSTRAVVTGAGSGLGRAFCLELAKRGARIIAADINLENARATAAMVGDGNAHAVHCDVSKPEAVAALAEEAERKLGGTDLVVNNAGVAVAGLIGDVPLEDWQWIVGVNFWGVVHGCHEFVPRFRKQGHGKVINVASTAGLVASPHMAPYNATKSAVVALSETLAAELAGTKISVTVLCPTFFRTNIANSGRALDQKMKPMIDKLMDRASLQAPDVARVALETADAGRLYALPHSDGRWMWRLKRAAPEAFQQWVGKGLFKMTSRMRG